MPASDIVIKGAREHNLRDVDLVLPRNRLICFTGVSGSGKSSLAFDTLYAEGQRRYVESLSSFARQFLGQMPKPDVDLISGLSPSISISQKSGGQNPRSTVGTITEIYDYLRVLYARVGGATAPSAAGRSPPKAARRSSTALRVCRPGRSSCPGPADPRPKGGIPRPVRRPAQAGLRAGPGRRQRGAPDRRCGWTGRCGTTSRWSSTAWWPGPKSARGWPRPSSWRCGWARAT